MKTTVTAFEEKLAFTTAAVDVEIRKIQQTLKSLQRFLSSGKYNLEQSRVFWNRTRVEMGRLKHLRYERKVAIDRLGVQFGS